MGLGYLGYPNLGLGYLGRVEGCPLSGFGYSGMVGFGYSGMVRRRAACTQLNIISLFSLLLSLSLFHVVCIYVVNV